MDTIPHASSSPQSTSSPAPLRILLVEDHTIVREGTRELLEQERDLTVAAAVGTAEEALACCSTLTPDIVLVDLHLPGMDGISLIRLLSQAAPSVRSIMLSAFGDPIYVTHAFAAGASGYLLKTASPDELAAAVRSVAAGASVLDRSLSPLLTAPLIPPSLLDGLSPREKEILALLADGHSNKEMAQELHLSVRTVESYASHLYVKLNVRTRTEAVVAALRLREASL